MKEPHMTYFQTRNAFVDSNGITNEKFLAWEKEHKVLAKKFKNNFPPDELAAKRVLPEDAVGAVLSQGRSQGKKRRK